MSDLKKKNKDEVLIDALSWSASAAIIEYHRLGGLDSRNSFSYSFGGWKSETRVPRWVVCSVDSSLGVQMAAFSLYAHMFSSCEQGERASALVSQKGTNPITRAPPS